MYLEDVVTSAQLVDSSAETQDGFIKVETLLRIQRLKNQANLELTVEKCTVSYTPSLKLEQVFTPPKKKFALSRFFSNSYSTEVTTKDEKLSKGPGPSSLIKVK